MDVSFLIKEYFKGFEDQISIDVFDAQSLNTLYAKVLNILTSHYGG